MNFIKPEDVIWKQTKIIKLNTEGPAEQHPYEYQFDLPVPLADWDVFDYWEKERFDSMRDNLKQGMVLFDIGAEQGWCNLIYAKFVGPENMVLIEPTQEFWPNIKQIWHRNFGESSDPMGFYDGFFSDKSTDPRFTKSPQEQSVGESLGTFFDTHGWPMASDGNMIDRNKYQYIDDNSEAVPEITIDDYVKFSGIVPNALTMDTEGAEIAILRGAKKTLTDNDVLVWVSIHPDLAIQHGFGDTKNVHEFMEKLGYKGEYLATDHEEHWLFRKTA